MALLAFEEVRLPTDISFGSVFGPEFSTDIVPYGGGTEQRADLWSQGRMRGEVRYANKTVVQLQALLTFFYARRGKAQGFRFKHHLDYQATRVEFGQGNGVSTVFQLLKYYVSGGETYIRSIRKPVGVEFPIGNTYDSVTVYVDGAPQTGGYALDYATGLMTLYPAPAVGQVLEWSGEFDVPVRFDTDRLAESLVAVYGVESVTPPQDPAMGVSWAPLGAAFPLVVEATGEGVAFTLPGDEEIARTVVGGQPVRWTMVGQVFIDATGVPFTYETVAYVVSPGTASTLSHVFAGVGMAEPLPLVELLAA